MRFNQEIEGQIDDLFAPYNQPHSPGFAVGIVHEGRFVYQKGFGQATLEHHSPITSRTVFDVGSMAKQFVGMATALLEEDGQLKVTDEILTYLPELSAYAQGVTIADLLHHTSGIRNYTVLAYYMIGYHESDAITKEEVYDLLVRQKSLSFRPGERWEYSDSNYFLLAQIVEKVSRTTLGQYANARIFSPLAMDQTLFRECHSQIVRNRAMSYVRHPIAFRSPYTYRKAGDMPAAYHTLVSNYEHVGAEGLYTSLDDLFKWDRNIAANRLGKGEHTLVDRILTPGRLRNGESTGYGYGVNIGTLKGERFLGHDGAIHGYTSSMAHFPDRDTSIICLANHNTVGSWVFRDRIIALVFPGHAFAVNAPSTSPPTAADEEVQTIVGAYQDPETASIWEIIHRDGKVVVQVNRSWDLEITPVGPWVFGSARPDMDLQLKFMPDDKGRIREIQGCNEGTDFTLVAFLDRPLGFDELAVYVGQYHSEELQTTFLVDTIEGKLRLENRNRHFCSMDLMYEPTIKDSFVSYDPHPISSRITFLREGDRITAFVYRDYDGDKREDLKFLRSSA